MFSVTMIIAQTPPSHIHGGFCAISLTGMKNLCSVMIINAARSSHATEKLIPAVMNGDLKNLRASVLMLACTVDAIPAIRPISTASMILYFPIQLSSDGLSLKAFSLEMSSGDMYPLSAAAAITSSKLVSDTHSMPASAMRSMPFFMP